MGLGLSLQSNTVKNIVDNYINMVSEMSVAAYNETKPTNLLTQKVEQKICNYADCWKGADPTQIPTPTVWGEMCKVGSITIDQNLTASTVVTAESLSSVSQNVQNNIATATEQFVKNVSAANPGLLSAAFAGQFTDTSFAAYLSANVKTSINADATQICSTMTVTDQGVTQLICASVGGIVISQNASITNVVSCIMKQVIKQVGTNSTINNVLQRADNIASAGESWNAYIIIAVIVVIILMVLFALYKYWNKQQDDENGTKPPSGKPPTTTIKPKPGQRPQQPLPVASGKPAPTLKVQRPLPALPSTTKF